MTVVELARIDSRRLLLIDGCFLSVYCEHLDDSLVRSVACSYENLTWCLLVLARGSVDENV